MQNTFRNRFVFLVTASFLVAWGSAVSLWAGRIPADQVRISTPVYAPEKENFSPQLGRYTYSVSWNGIAAGTVNLELNREQGDYRIVASAQTADFVSLFYRLRYRSEAVLCGETLLPKRMESVARENSRRKETALTFAPDGTISAVRKDSRGRLERLDFKPENFTLDPYSAGFLALNLDWKVGDTRRFDTFDGKSRYLVELTALEEAAVKVNGRTRPAIVIRPRVTKLTDTEGKSKLEDARIYIATDSSPVILKIVSDSFIGSVNTKMESFTPAGAAAVSARQEAPSEAPRVL